MIFINPMWDHESQRIGKMTCSPNAYRLHVISDLFGGIGLYSLFGLIIYAVVCAFTSYNFPSYWLFIIPFILGIIGTVLFIISEYIILKKGFEYDPKERKAFWIEDGKTVSYSCAEETESNKSE